MRKKYWRVLVLDIWVFLIAPDLKAVKGISSGLWANCICNL